MAEKKILVVDYDPQSLMDLSALFSSLKLEVIEAEDGQQAYEKFRSEKPDLVVLEAMLPKLHGFDLTQKIHQESRGNVPVVIVTGLYKGAQYRNEALTSFGAADYFEKPVNREKLAQAVLNLLHDEVLIDEELPGVEEVLKVLEEEKEDPKA